MGGLAYLASLPFIDPDRIAVVGYSQGALGGVETLFDRHFRTAIAYYPGCWSETGAVSIPTVILIGALDDWTPARDCEAMIKRRTGQGAPLKLIVYPGAYHAFNARSLIDSSARGVQPSRRIQRSCRRRRLEGDGRSTAASISPLRSPKLERDRGVIDVAVQPLHRNKTLRLGPRESWGPPPRATSSVARGPPLCRCASETTTRQSRPGENTPKGPQICQIEGSFVRRMVVVFGGKSR
jgi:hypothetical protein